MKKSLLYSSLIVFSALFAGDEIALVFKNEDSHPTENITVSKKDFSRILSQYFKRQTKQISHLLQGSTDEMFQKLEIALNQNLSQWKQEFASTIALGLQKNSPQDLAYKKDAPSGKMIEEECSKCTVQPACQKMDLPPAYNGAVQNELACPYHVFGDASFLYWKAVQEGMQTYTLYSLQTTFITSTETRRIEEYQTGSIDFEYKPGFQVGLGVELPYDDWQLYSEYTWYHHQFSDSFRFQGPNSFVDTGVAAYTFNLFPDFTLKMNDYSNYLLMPSSLNSKFDLNLNWIFLELARNYYVGKTLTFRTHFGLRGDRNTQKITQEFDLSQTTDGETLFNANCSGKVEQSSRSWAIGPRAGIRADYLLGCGFKIFGDLAASLLYSQFDLKASQNSTIHFPTDHQIQSSSINPQTLETVRPNLEMGLGMGWGTGFKCNDWHLDLLFSYDFNAMWNQNVFRELQDEDTNTDSGDGSSARVLYRDLFLHGLTAKLGLAF